MEARNKPAHEIRLGKIRVTIWANSTEDHDIWFNATVSRIYRDESTWKDATTFRRDDLPVLSKALDMAYEWIWSRCQAHDSNGS